MPSHKPGTELRPGSPLAFADVLAARRRIREHLDPTPVARNPALDEVLGCAAYVKCENLQPIGAFKVRGGVNYMLTLPAEERQRGVVTASTGNHGQSIAYAARICGVRATIFAPAAANPLKVDSMRRLGAEVVLAGPDFDASKRMAEEHGTDQGMRFISSGDEPALIAGVATAYLELLEAVPDLDLIIVPVGGGSGAAGACVVRDGVKPDCKVIGVQAAAAPALHDSWRGRRVVKYDSAPTFADGLATREPFVLPMSIMLDGLADFWLVSEEEMKEAIRLLAHTTHVLAEGAGAAAAAAAMKQKAAIAGRKVGLMLSGGNLPLGLLREILTG